MIGKKGSISEDDTALLLQRYSATTILALLQEVYQFADAKINWDMLVKRTTTGISNAREYQMLWRHLAYHDPLVEKLENEAEALDDDSDLEVELEPCPSVSPESFSEAATAVKVLLSHGLANHSGPPNRPFGEATLAVTAANSQTLGTPSETVHLANNSEGLDGKQSSQAVTVSDAVDGNGATNPSYPQRRKRKLWTKEEDQALKDAVKKCGEGNWANIVKGEFTHDRTASQLSQRWAIIRKKEAALNPPGSSNLTSSLSEAQLAAQAVSIALDKTKIRSLSTTGPVNPPSATGSTPDPNVAPVLRQSLPLKSRSTHKKPSTSAPVRCTIKDVAVAAGARIATPSAVASLMKAAQSEHAVHIKQFGPRMLTARPNFHYVQSTTVSTAGGSKRTLASGQPMPANRAAQQGKPVAPAVPASLEDVKKAGKNLGSSSGVSEASVLEKAPSDSKISKKPSVVAECAYPSPTASVEDQTLVEKQPDLSLIEVDDNQKMVAGVTPESAMEEKQGDLPAKDENQSVRVAAILQTGEVGESIKPV